MIADEPISVRVKYATLAISSPFFMFIGCYVFIDSETL